jgi:Holliday junction resolvase
MIQVTKASGQLEPLSLDKVRSSLRRAGADAPTIDRILLALKPALYDKIQTREVYAQVFKLLSQFAPQSAYRYRLKPTLMELGPDGYRFEEFIGRLFAALGYQIKLRQILAGRCVNHEVDVVAEKLDQRLIIECKFHNRSGIKAEIKDALYTQARFTDIDQAAPGKYKQIWLVTNTKLTSQAIAYGRCQHMGLLAWRYPVNAGIEKLIDKYDLYHLLKLGYSEK